jgi:hypothetical protein
LVRHLTLTRNPIVVRGGSPQGRQRCYLTAVARAHLRPPP